MSSFITWIEVKGRADPFVLVDNDVFLYSTERKEEFKIYKNVNDILGEDAIIKHFKLKRSLVTVKTVSDFWNTKKLHPKIAEMFEHFDRHWLYFLQNKFFRSTQLLSIIAEISESNLDWNHWKRKAWNQIQLQKTSTWQLATFLEFNFLTTQNKKMGEDWKERIAEKILDQTETEIKDLVRFYFLGRHKNQKERAPRVDLWGLHIIKKIFPSTHRFWALSDKKEKNFQNDLARIKVIKERR